jgi:peptidoglycan/xylan/chitin deacetylase (PgdA/CDA1 family)
VQGEYGEREPDAVAEIVGRGHELGMHGWAHEPWSELAADEERELAARATGALQRAAGIAPAGFRAPAGARTPRTATVLAALGYRYDASLSDAGDMEPSVLPGGVAQVPFVWAGVDGAYYLRPEPADPEEVRGAWRAALGRDLFVAICHAEITGATDDRLAVLDDVMGAAVADDRVHTRTIGEVAEQVRSNP